MKLEGAVTQGSGPVNEDGWGFGGTAEDVSAAWIFDGVTGINDRNYLPAGTDAAWLVARAHGHLLNFAAADLPLGEILHRLVAVLIEDWRAVSGGLDLPQDYDPPAACLILAKRYGSRWQAVRLGDSCLLARADDGNRTILAAAPNNNFDRWLSVEARKRRDAGVLDMRALLAEFRPVLLQSRATRNRPGGYGILEANAAATRFAEYLDLGLPGELLLCTDGYYRGVDHYDLYSDESLIEASLGGDGVNRVLQLIRAVEAADATCQKHIRFKPADDATAVMLRSLK
jgi:hypothetical protein